VPTVPRVEGREEEKRLTEAVTNGSGTAEDYTELAEILSDSGRFDPAVRLLREALGLPFTDPARADISISLGWILIDGNRDLDEALLLGRQAAALTQATETTASLLTRANAQSLIAYCISMTDREGARDSAISALALFEQVANAGASLDISTIYNIHFDAARLNCVLGREAEALRCCEEALKVAPDENEIVLCMSELGSIYQRQGRLTEARRILASATTYLDVEPGRPFAHYSN
jgi:tetratricopeptide (TPR) repeat protein